MGKEIEKALREFIDHLNISPQEKREIEQIASQMQCSQNFMCCQSAFANICQAKDIGLESYLKCMEPECFECAFCFYYGSVSYCSCELRRYIARHINR